MVGDDVQIDLHAARMGRLDQGLHRFRLAEMRIGAGEVGDPVAVEAGHRPADRRLHRLVLEDGGQPDGGGAQALQIVQLLHHSGQIAAVVEFGARRIEAAGQSVRRIAAVVVGGVAVGEAVGQQEVDDLVLGRTLTHGLEGRGGGRLGRRLGRGGPGAQQTQAGGGGEQTLPAAWRPGHGGPPCPVSPMRCRGDRFASFCSDGRACQPRHFRLVFQARPHVAPQYRPI
ncbi:hypothetical protein D3C72_1309490 [compost metagenome]